MIEKETTTKLPEEKYEVTVSPLGAQPTNFSVEPLPDDIKNMIIEAESLGADVKLMPEKNPTSIFLNYSNEKEPTKEFGHTVVGVEMNMHLNLLGNYHNGNRKRARNFLSDLRRVSMEESFPKESSSNSVRWVEIIRTYNY